MMAVSMEFLENGRIACYTVVTPWTIAEMLKLFKVETQHRDQFQKEHPTLKIHLIVDMSQSHNIPQGFLQARYAPGDRHPTAGKRIIVGASPLIRNLANVIQRLVRNDGVSFVDTRDAAIASLQQTLANEAQMSLLQAQTP